MKNTKIGQILKRLMAEQKIRVTELARRVNLPQPTVHRIVTGICEHPHLSSLKPLADFFSITVEQLKGHEPLGALETVTRVPLLEWGEIHAWLDKEKVPMDTPKVITDAKVSAKAFALKVKDAAMDPVFPIHSVLIVDPDRPPKDRSFVVALLHNYFEPIFRQLLMNAGENYLKPLSPDLECYKMIKIIDNDKIIGTVIQAKRDWEF